MLLGLHDTWYVRQCLYFTDGQALPWKLPFLFIHCGWQHIYNGSYPYLNKGEMQGSICAYLKGGKLNKSVVIKRKAYEKSFFPTGQSAHWRETTGSTITT